MGDDRPLVGAAIPVYNGERYIADALRSVLTQSYPISDVVVVDDGSSDATVATALEIGPPIRVVIQQHLGVGPARTQAVNLVRGDAIVLLDADDLLTPDSVGCRMRVLQDRPEVDIVFGQIRSFAQVAGGHPQPLDERRPAPVAGAMLVRRRAFDRVGPFAADLRVAEGLDWLLRARDLGLTEATVDEQVQWRRVHGANNSLIQRDAINEFPRALKASLDRRRGKLK